MSQSRSANELKNFVPNTRKINGQTLENDVEINEVKSAEKLKTARTINGVEFNGTYDIKVYGEGELPQQFIPTLKVGWYRFAHINSSSTSATIRIARNYGNGYPELYTLIFNSTYNDCGFIQLSSRFFEGSQHVTKLRAVFNSQGDFYLDFYYNYELPNTVAIKVYDIMSSLHTDNYSNLNTEVDSIPEGYSVKEFDLSFSAIKAPSIEIGNTKLTETQLQSLLALLTT
jgi:hypothetical protein